MRFENTIDIDRAAADVFAYVSDQTKAPDWQMGLLEVKRLTDGPIGIGSRHTFVRTVAGKRVPGENEYYGFEPGHMVEFLFRSGSMTGRGSYRVETLDPKRTRLHTTLEIDLIGLARIAGPMIAMSIRREDNADLAALKETLERDRVPHAEPDTRSGLEDFPGHTRGLDSDRLAE